MGHTRVSLLSLNHSGPRQKKGCTIAISTKFARTHIRCVHHWMPGRILGLPLQCGQGRRAGDVYVISAYAPVHDERTQTVASDPLRLELLKNLNGEIRQIPNMCRVMLWMDVNGEVYTTLPWNGNAGNRIRDRRQRWTQNGHELSELLRSNRLVAMSTFAEANRQCWTWLSPFGTRHRLDYMTTRQTDADHGRVKVDYSMPVGLSGFRDRRPLFARVCTRARW